MGSVAPRTAEPQANPPGYGERRVAQPMVSALQELEAYLGIRPALSGVGGWSREHRRPNGRGDAPWIADRRW